jgi:hypothetical protein
VITDFEGLTILDSLLLSSHARPGASILSA